MCRCSGSWCPSAKHAVYLLFMRGKRGTLVVPVASARFGRDALLLSEALGKHGVC